MGNEVIVYGSRMLAEMLYYDSLRHPDFKIAAFIQDEEYLDASGYYLGLPQVGLGTVLEKYPIRTFDMIVLTASYHDMRNRDDMYNKAKALGYNLRNYLSPSSIVSPNVVMGENNIIFEQTFLGAGVQMGSCNTIRQQVYIGHDFRMGDNNVITPGCKIGGDCRIEDNCYIGLGSTIMNGIVISEESLVGAGSVVIKNTEPFTKNVGNPSRAIGYHKEEGLKVKL